MQSEPQQINVEHEYSCLLAGAIGAGKSTTLNNINSALAFGIVPEYIDGMENGKEMLQKWIAGDLGHKEFQQFILNSQDFLCTRVAGSKRRIFERCPIEGALVFSISNSHFDWILRQAEKLHRKHGIPDPRDPSTRAVVDASRPFEEVISEVHRIIEDDIRNGVKLRSIYLRIPSEVSASRVNTRGRESEDGYDYEYLQTICERYDTLFGLNESSKPSNGLPKSEGGQSCEQL